MKLEEQKCVPCEGGVDKMTPEKINEMLPKVENWEVHDEKLHKTFKFKDFVNAMKFLNQMADIAEAEGHHPDFCVHYNRVDVTIWTHAIGGLSENDFILAAKLNTIQI